MSRSKRAPRHGNKRRRDVVVLIGLFAIPAVVLLPVIHLSTAFTVSLRTKGLQFKTSDRQGKSIGLFNSNTPFELTIERFQRIELRDGAKIASISNTSGQAVVAFHDV